MRPRERYTIDRNTGAINVHRSVDAEPIMEAMKAYGDFIDRHTQRKRAQRIVGSLDPITASLWAKEWDTFVGSKEFARLAVARLRNDIDYRKFRVGG